MDTLIGTFNLTENQIANLGTLNVSPFKGGKYDHDTGNYIAVSEIEPTQAEKDALASAINALPETLDASVYEARFNVDLMTARLGEEFTGVDAVALAPYLGAIQSYGKARNFVGMKEFINGLVALGNATQAQGVTMKSVVLEQGINLDNY